MTRAFIGMVAAVVSGCAQYTPTVTPDQAPTGREAYLYGSFKAGAAVYGGVTDLEMGFVFRCGEGRTSKQYTLRFNYDNPVQAVKVAPGTCSLVEVVYTNTRGVVRGRKPAPDGMYRNLQLNAGTAYYLGDYYAEMMVGDRESRWRVREITNEYARTTQFMKEQYPALAGIPTEDLMPKQ